VAAVSSEPNWTPPPTTPIKNNLMHKWGAFGTRQTRPDLK
jgi:hypothetical protein